MGELADELLTTPEFGMAEEEEGGLSGEEGGFGWHDSGGDSGGCLSTWLSVLITIHAALMPILDPAF
jgi:hypothetical protein